MSSYFVECTEPGRRPFIAAGDLMEHDARYWHRVYSERHPKASFEIKRHGGHICSHGIPSRGFCQICEA